MCNRSCLAKVDVERGEGCTGYCQTVRRRCLQRVEVADGRLHGAIVGPREVRK